MTGRVGTFVVAGAVVALAAVTMSPLVASSQRGGREQFTVRSLDRKTPEAAIDVDGDGSEEGIGDQIVGAGPLFRGGERVGSERHVCTFLKSSRRGAMLRCEGTFNIDGRGSLEIAGVLKFSREGAGSTFTITGGTAAFRGASGTMDLEGRENGEVFRFKVYR